MAIGIHTLHFEHELPATLLPLISEEKVQIQYFVKIYVEFISEQKQEFSAPIQIGRAALGLSTLQV